MLVKMENPNGAGESIDGKTGTIEYCYRDGSASECTVTLTEAADFIIGLTTNIGFTSGSVIASPEMQIGTRGTTISWKSHNNYASVSTATLSADGMSITESRDANVGNTDILIGTWD